MLREDFLGLDVIDLHAVQALCASQVDLIGNMSRVANERIVLQLFHVVRSDELEVSL